MTRHEKEKLMEIIDEVAEYVNSRIEHGDDEWQRNYIVYENSEWIVETTICAKGRFEYSWGDYYTPSSYVLDAEWVDVDEVAVYHKLDAKYSEDVESEDIEDFIENLKTEIEC